MPKSTRRPPCGLQRLLRFAGLVPLVTFGFSCHEVPNLYVAGPGIFPTCGASNPTYTIFALSLRAAENLSSNWGAIAG